MLQQLLPFTVLKPANLQSLRASILLVATALTVYGIETTSIQYPFLRANLVATALTVYGIETSISELFTASPFQNGCNSSYRLRY